MSKSNPMRTRLATAYATCRSGSCKTSKTRPCSCKGNWPPPSARGTSSGTRWRSFSAWLEIVTPLPCFRAEGIRAASGCYKPLHRDREGQASRLVCIPQRMSSCGGSGGRTGVVCGNHTRESTGGWRWRQEAGDDKGSAEVYGVFTTCMYVCFPPVSHCLSALVLVYVAVTSGHVGACTSLLLRCIVYVSCVTPYFILLFPG